MLIVLRKQREEKEKQKRKDSDDCTSYDCNHVCKVKINAIKTPCFLEYRKKQAEKPEQQGV